MGGKTVRTFLVDGDPKGIKIVSTLNKICAAILVPRAKLCDAAAIKKLAFPAVYILLDEDGKQVCVGAASNFLNAIEERDVQKDFWKIALVFISRDEEQELSCVDTEYLKYLALNHISAGFTLYEQSAVQAHGLQEDEKAAIDEFFDDMKFLTSSLGYDVFDQ